MRMEMSLQKVLNNLRVAKLHKGIDLVQLSLPESRKPDNSDNPIQCLRVVILEAVVGETMGHRALRNQSHIGLWLVIIRITQLVIRQM